MITVHCMIHGQALASDGIEPDLRDFINTAATVASFVKCKEQFHLFCLPCEEIGARHGNLHLEMLWLSQWKPLQLELSQHRETAVSFMKEDHLDIPELFGLIS